VFDVSETVMLYKRERKAVMDLCFDVEDQTTVVTGVSSGGAHMLSSDYFSSIFYFSRCKSEFNTSISFSVLVFDIFTILTKRSFSVLGLNNFA